MEDFVAVIWLTVLSGVATTGSAGVGDIGILTMKLAIFAVATLTIGAPLVLQRRIIWQGES